MTIKTIKIFPRPRPMSWDAFNHAVFVAETLTNKGRALGLDLYLGGVHFDAHIKTIVALVRHHSTQNNLDLEFDQETLLHLLTVSTDTAKGVLYSLSQEQRKRLDSTRVRLELTRVEKGLRQLRCKIWIVATNRVIHVSHLNHEVDLGTMSRLAEEYKSVYDEIVTQIDTFIESSLLKEHYAVAYIQARRTEIMSSIAMAFTEFGTLVRIDSSQPYLYQQLFTNENESPRAIFYKIFARMKRATVHFHKNTMTLACHEMSHNATILRELLDESNSCLTNPEEYRALLNEKTTKHVDVCQLSTDQHCKSVTILEKASYAKIVASLKRVASLKDSIITVDTLAKMKTYAEAQESIASVADERTDLILAEGAKQGVKNTEENLHSFLSARIVAMSNKVSGIEPVCQMIGRCVNHTIKKAYDEIDKRGVTREAVRDHLALTTEVIKLEAIDHTTFPEHLRDNHTPLLIRDHKKLNVPISTINCVAGDQWFAQSIVPCLLNPQIYCAAENMIVNNGGTIHIHFDSPERQSPLRRKRKRSLCNAEKSVRLITKRDARDTHVYDYDEDLLTIVVESKRVKSVDYTERRTCPVCHKTASLKSFCQRQSKQPDYIYERNICHTCRLKYSDRKK